MIHPNYIIYKTQFHWTVLNMTILLMKKKKQVCLVRVFTCFICLYCPSTSSWEITITCSNVKRAYLWCELGELWSSERVSKLVFIATQEDARLMLYNYLGQFWKMQTKIVSVPEFCILFINANYVTKSRDNYSFFSCTCVVHSHIRACIVNFR